MRPRLTPTPPTPNVRADMAFEFKLPDIGEGVVEGEVVKWLVQAGDAVEVDQPMVEVMTDKATVVIPCPVKGVVVETRGDEGDLVEVHSVICVIDTDGGAPAEAPTAAEPEPAPAPPPPPMPAPVPARASGAKVLAAPATRRLARELRVDLSAVAGTGPAGRVLEADVRAAAAGGRLSDTPPPSPSVAAVPPPPVAAPRGGAAAPAPAVAASAPAVSAPAPARLISLPGEVEERIPVRGLRRRIWDKMAQSVSSAAHFTFVEECDCSALVEMRQRFNARRVEGEAKLTYLPFIVKAVVAALRAFPTLNGHVDEDAPAFVQRRDYHIGIAVSSDRGLVVPVVRHADRRSIVELSAEVFRLAEAVRTNTIAPDDLGGSTFTITSLGKDGGIFATPIINHPEVAIMGVHKMQKTPVVDDRDEIVIRPMMNLSLSFDHRLIDGHVGAAFTYAVIRLLEDPDRLMMEMA